MKKKNTQFILGNTEMCFTEGVATMLLHNKITEWWFAVQKLFLESGPVNSPCTRKTFSNWKWSHQNTILMGVTNLQKLAIPKQT